MYSTSPGREAFAVFHPRGSTKVDYLYHDAPKQVYNDLTTAFVPHSTADFLSYLITLLLFSILDALSASCYHLLRTVLARGVPYSWYTSFRSLHSLTVPRPHDRDTYLGTLPT